jgi:outer membrane immunogenic protein
MKWGAFIGGVTLAALVSLPAGAADMQVVRPIPATSGYIPAQFLWTGFYIGAGIGGSWANATFLDPLNPTATASFSPKGFLVSGISGINYQMSSFVVGVEADFTGTWDKGSATDSFNNNLATSVFWTASVTGRAGVAFDRLLIYFKGGVAFDYDRDTVTVPAGNTAIGSLYRVAWTVGGGMEYAVTDHWTGRLEYDYFRFPTKALSFQGTAVPLIGVIPGTVGGQVGLNIGEVKLIMAYKF